MGKKTIEDTYIENIENGMRAIRLGTKKPEDTNIGFNLNKLKPLNPGMYDDLIKRYKEVLNQYKAKLINSQKDSQ
jgi:hypothetical protein